MLENGARKDPTLSGSLGQRIRTFRRDHRLSASSLADQLGVSRPTLWSWETDRSVPRARNLVRLEGILGMDLGSPRAASRDQAGRGLDETIQVHKTALAKAIGLDVHNIKIEISV